MKTKTPSRVHTWCR